MQVDVVGRFVVCAVLFDPPCRLCRGSPLSGALKRLVVGLWSVVVGLFMVRGVQFPQNGLSSVLLCFFFDLFAVLVIPSAHVVFSMFLAPLCLHPTRHLCKRDLFWLIPLLPIFLLFCPFVFWTTPLFTN